MWAASPCTWHWLVGWVCLDGCASGVPLAMACCEAERSEKRKLWFLFVNSPPFMKASISSGSIPLPSSHILSLSHTLGKSIMILTHFSFLLVFSSLYLITWYSFFWNVWTIPKRFFTMQTNGSIVQFDPDWDLFWLDQILDLGSGQLSVITHAVLVQIKRGVCETTLA